MDTRPSAPTTLTPTGGSFQKSTDCVRTMVKDSQQNTCQPSPTCTKDPDVRTTTHQHRTMTQHPHVGHAQRLHWTAMEMQHSIRQTFPRHHFGSRVIHKKTVISRTMSGIHGRTTEATSSRKIQRQGAFVVDGQTERTPQWMMYVRCATFFDTVGREFLMSIPMGRAEDIPLAVG